MSHILTSESVIEGHPVLAGEITSEEGVNYETIARGSVPALGYVDGWTHFTPTACVFRRTITPQSLEFGESGRHLSDRVCILAPVPKELERMLDSLLAAFCDDALDPLLGLTCDVPFVRMSVQEGVCPVCGSRLDRSSEVVRRLEIACSAASCGFVLRARGRATEKGH